MDNMYSKTDMIKPLHSLVKFISQLFLVLLPNVTVITNISRD